MKKFIFYIFTVFIVACCFFAPSVSFAEDVAVCGNSTGKSYFADREMNPHETIGWTDDKMTGKFTFKKNDDGTLDLLYLDSTGSIKSSIAEGAKIVPASISDDAVSIVVLYPNSLVSSYTFQILNNKKMQVMWTQNKVETPFPKISAMVADCSLSLIHI